MTQKTAAATRQDRTIAFYQQPLSPQTNPTRRLAAGKEVFQVLQALQLKKEAAQDQKEAKRKANAQRATAYAHLTETGPQGNVNAQNKVEAGLLQLDYKRTSHFLTFLAH